jgi:chromosome segregation ATPase
VTQVAPIDLERLAAFLRSAGNDGTGLYFSKRECELLLAEMSRRLIPDGATYIPPMALSAEQRLDEKMLVLEQKFGERVKALDQFKNSAVEHMAGQRTRIAEVERDAERMDKRADEQGKRIEKLEKLARDWASGTDMQGRMNDHEDRMNAHRARIEKLEKNVAGHEQQIGALENTKDLQLANKFGERVKSLELGRVEHWAGIVAHAERILRLEDWAQRIRAASKP